MIKNFKEILKICSLISIFIFTTSTLSAISWDTSNWLSTAQEGVKYVVDTPPETETITVEVEGVSTLAKQNSGSHYASNSDTAPQSYNSTLSMNDLDVGQNIFGLEITNNSPRGFSLRIESIHANKLKRHVWNGTNFNDPFQREGVNNADTNSNVVKGNIIPYKVKMKYNTHGKDNGNGNGDSVYGVYDSSGDTHMLPTNFQALVDAPNVFKDINSSNSATTTSAGGNMDNFITFDFTEGNVFQGSTETAKTNNTQKVLHASSGFFITMFIQTDQTNFDKDLLLRGLFKDTINITLIDGY